MYGKRFGFQIFVLLVLFQQLLTLSQGYDLLFSCQLLKSKYARSLGLSTVAIPRELKVPEGNKLHICYSAKGVQKYSFNGTAWNNFNVSALLFTEHQVIARHFFLSEVDKFDVQPTWESFSPRGLVTAKILVKTAVSNDAIPWVLLQRTQISGSRQWFGKVTYVQRLFTIDGLPPNSSCPAAANCQEFESPYTAAYAFYVKQ